MRIGDKVKIKYKYILEIAKRDLELAKSLVDKTGVIIDFDDITWYFLVRFDNAEISFRKFQLEEVSD